MQQFAQILTANGPLAVAILGFLSALAALVRSEKLALDPTTPINGILQGRLARAGLAILPIIVADIVKGDPAATIINDSTAAIIDEEPTVAEDPAPVVAVPADLTAAIAAKQAELSALQAQAQGVTSA